MAQRQFRSDDTSPWTYGYGTGSDGAKTVSSSADYDGANAGCSGTSGATSLTLDAASSFADGDLVLIHQTRGTGVGTWELNKIASGGGSTSLTLTHSLINTYTDSGASQAQIVELKQYTTVTVNSSQTWTAPVWDENKGGIIAFLADTSVTVTGNISATGKGHLGATTPYGDSAYTGQGEGTGGTRNAQSASANGNGGGSSFTASGLKAGGGGGGNASTGTTGSNAGSSTGGVGGNAAGDAGLVTMVMGGGGSCGGYDGSGGDRYNGNKGGGIVLIISPSITVTGTVVADGETNAGSGGSNVGGGGGGAGGSILYKGKTLTLGSNLTSSLGTSGRTGVGGSGSGGAGSNGRVHADYATSLSGTSNPTIDSRVDSSLLLSTAGGFILTIF
jgi:large repetitive protein